MLLAVLVLISTAIMTEMPRPVSGLSPHDPIFIQGDANFTITNGVTLGDGTPSNPYIIEGWSIEASSSNGIEIRDTDDYLLIRNVSILESELSDSLYAKGIYLANVTNCNVEKVKVSGFYNAIHLNSCTYVTVVGSDFSYNSHHLITSGCEHTTISENRIVSANRGNGIWIVGSMNSTIYHNSILNCSIGIHIDECTDSLITDNHVSNGYDDEYNVICINLYKSSNSQIYHNNFIQVEKWGCPHANDYDGISNSWDNGYPSGGNYWSDYTGVDSNKDGIGDSPYYISDSLGPHPESPPWDCYPLMCQCSTSPDSGSEEDDSTYDEDPNGIITRFGDSLLLTGMIAAVIAAAIAAIYLRRKRKEVL